MYIPKHFEETDESWAFELIRRNPLCTLIMASQGVTDANHVPLCLDTSNADTVMLLGHIPRANPISEIEGTRDALAIFHGPNSYISPSWYATKKETGKVVPTWNYQVVHIYGSVRIIDDPDWILSHLESLTNQQEKTFDDPWKVGDAPEEFTAHLLKMLVGIEMEITRVTSKSKVSQNQPEENRRGVVAGLRKSKRAADKEMADIVETTKPIRSLTK